MCLQLGSGSLSSVFLDGGSLQKTDGQEAWRHIDARAVQRHQKRKMQEAQPPHEVEAELGGQGIALIKRGQDCAAGLADTSIIHGHHQQRVVAPTSALLQDRLEQILYFPVGAAVKLIVSAPILILATESPEDPRQSAPAQGQ